jgi:hypothetical protein
MNPNILMPIMISMTRSYHKSKQYYRLDSVSPRTSVFFLFISLLIALFSITSCEEKPTLVGSGLLPGGDFVSIKSDTSVHIEAYTVRPDSIITNSRTYSYLGRLTDPYFGDNRCDFVGQLRLLQRWPGGELPIVDSAKIYLTLYGAKGTLDSTTIHKINIYEINEILNSTNKYYSNRDPNAGKLLATVSLPPIPRDTLRHLVINLPRSFGEYILRDTSKLSQDKDGNPFKSFFKGLYMTMEDSQNPFLAALMFNTSEFMISVYYHNTAGTNLYYDFTMSSTSVRYNRYFHNYASATSPYKVSLQNIANKTKDSLIYLQAFNGVSPQIKFPGIKAIRTMLWDSVNKIVRGSINKARLTFSVFLDESTFTSSTVPPAIALVYAKSDTARSVVPDYVIGANHAFFDGNYNSTTKTYSFNLSAFMQEYLKGNITDPVVYMYVPEGEFANVILRANKSPVPVKFELVYTKL